MSSYDPSQWYSYSKNRPNEVPSKIVVADTETNVADSSNIDRKQSDENIALASDTSQQQEQSGLEEMPKREEVKLDSITPLQSSNSKVNNFIKRLQKMVRELPSCYKRKVTYDVICQLAESLIDDTVFEIAKGLEDIQQLSETNLLNKRMKILSDQKGIRFLTLLTNHLHNFCFANIIVFLLEILKDKAHPLGTFNAFEVATSSAVLGSFHQSSTQPIPV